MRRSRTAAELGFTLVELVVVMTVIGILVTIPIASFLHFRDQANDATARANVHVVVPSIESYFADNSTYVGMTLAGLKASYDHAIDPARYTLTSLTATGYCVSSSAGGRTWKKAGPGAQYTSGGCP